MISAALDSTTSRLLIRSHPLFGRALAWARTISKGSPEGVTPLGEEPGFVGLVGGSPTRPRENCVWESHRHTVDVQVGIDGSEIIEWTDPGQLIRFGEYQAEKDRDEWTSTHPPLGQWRLRPGEFVVFLAGEPHRPTIADGHFPTIFKAVAKIPTALLG